MANDDPLTNFKYIYSTCLLIFSIVLIMGLIFTDQTKLASDVSPVLAFFVLWIAVIWLTMVEGSQGSLVGLPPVDMSLYSESHVTSYKIMKMINKGDNLDRYLLGRQSMVVLVVFMVNFSGAPIADAELWGLPSWLQNMFLGSGLAMILFTCMVGQLNSQINGCHCMLDYINNYFAVFTVYVARGIEFSGLLHSSYLIQLLVAQLAGKPIVSLEEPRNGMENVFFWGRCLMSLGILGFAFAVTLVALFDGKTTIWEGIPAGVAVVIFFILLCVVGLLEGMQIAFFAVAKLRECERGEARFAKMVRQTSLVAMRCVVLRVVLLTNLRFCFVLFHQTCELLFRGKARNLSGFMVGRQLCVVSCMFFVARITSVEIAEGESNIFNVSDGFQKFMDTGLLGALIVTIVASIAWQLVASAFPIAFLSNPLVYIFLRICLLLEATGLCSGAWVLAKLHKKLAGFKRDEVYIGTAEERAAMNKPDDESVYSNHEGHLYPGQFADPHDEGKDLAERVEDLERKLATVLKEKDTEMEA